MNNALGMLCPKIEAKLRSPLLSSFTCAATIGRYYLLALGYHHGCFHYSFKPALSLKSGLEDEFHMVCRMTQYDVLRQPWVGLPDAVGVPVMENLMNRNRGARCFGAAGGGLRLFSFFFHMHNDTCALIFNELSNRRD